MAEQGADSAPRFTPPLPRRRGWQFIVIVVVATFALVGAAAAGWYYARVSAPPSGPVVLISIDTLRADHLPAYGYRKVATPAIDRLAAEGTVFERAYAHSPQTFPSHAAILSGRLPFQNGVRDNVGFAIRPDLRMLPKMLQNRGWKTGGVVSAYLLRKELGLDRGFDFYDSQMPAAPPDTPAGRVERPGGESLGVAEKWMNRLSSPRFFLFFHLNEPHAPYEPPARFSRFSPYDGEIARSDEIVGQLLAYLQRRGWYDEATIILLSDHGEGLGDHGEQEHGLFLYDETIRVPLIIRLPKAEHAGRRIATPVQHVDLVPTILDWLGAPRPSGLPGRSLRHLLDGSDPVLADAGFYAESLYGRYHFGWSELYALTDARYRFIKAPRAELYDLEQDPRERTNQAADRVPAAAAMRSALDKLLGGAAIPPQAAVSREDLERLQSLGYLGTRAGVPAEAPGDSLPDPKDHVAVLGAFRQAVELSERRRHDEAIALLSTIVAADPAMKEAYAQLGLELARAGRPEEALRVFRHVVGLDPADAASLVSVSGVLLSLGRLDEATANAEAALKLAPADDRRTRDRAFETLVRISLSRRNADAARRYAAAAAREDAGSALPSFAEATLLYNAGKYEESLPAFQQTLQALEGRGDAMADVHYCAGDALSRLGRNEEAEAQFQQEIRLFPDSPRAYGALAALYQADGRGPEAEEVVERLLRTVPTADGCALAAKLWTSLGDKKRAADAQAQARALAASRAKSAAAARPAHR
jgi:choline-sulfatase